MIGSFFQTHAVRVGQGMADTDADLPKAAVKKVVKQGLPPGQPDAQGRPRETHVNKDALLAFTEGAQV